MSPLASLSHIQEWLSALFHGLLRQGPIQALAKLLEAWNVLSHLWEKIHYHGMYEILDYDATLEIVDPKGEKAIFTRREVVRFLQDNVVAIHDHAWGDGKLFAKYSCQPGVPVDFYEDGSKYNVLISLRETKNRGEGQTRNTHHDDRHGLSLPKGLN